MIQKRSTGMHTARQRKWLLTQPRFSTVMCRVTFFMQMETAASIFGLAAESKDMFDCQ